MDTLKIGKCLAINSSLEMEKFHFVFLTIV